MTEQYVISKDRLVERGLIDRVGFLGFAGGGALAIVLSKMFAVPALVIAVGACAIIIGYAVLIQRTGTGRLRSDQAGDNCYYLGLIFTLASLAYAIFTFDPADTATTIIQGFGVALATTILGLVLRVYFNQSRPDLAEAETTARLELAAASGKLKSELSRSVVSMNDFSRQTRQSLEELRDEIVTSLQATRAAAELAVTESSKRATDIASEHADAATVRSKKVTAATDKVVVGMERHAGSLDAWASSQERVAGTLAAIEAAATTTQAILDRLAEQTEQTARLQTTAADRANDLREATSALREQIAALASATENFGASVVAKIGEVQALPQSVADGAVAGIADAIDRLRRDLHAIADAQSALTASVADQAATSVGIAAKHNDALEQELTRSRENVGKVHAALVDMTGQLAERAEAHSR